MCRDLRIVPVTLTWVSSTVPKTPSPWAAFLSQATENVAEETVNYIFIKMGNTLSKAMIKDMLLPLLPPGTTCPNSANVRQLITAVLHASSTAERDLLLLIHPARPGRTHVTMAHQLLHY